MNKKEKENWLRELNWRKDLWERKCVEAKKRMQVKGEELLGVIDLEVAEATLKRIEVKKRGIWDEDKSKLDPVTYPVPISLVKYPKPISEFPERANMHTHNLSPEEEDGIQYAKVTKTTTVKKKSHNNPKALFALREKKHVGGEHD